MTLAALNTEIDVREIAPRERVALIVSAFRALGAKESMDIVSDHDPKPLYQHLQVEQPDRFSWRRLENGPDVWRVRVTKFSARHSDGQCCGACGGA